jgi:phage regulator Rha-like protein
LVLTAEMILLNSSNVTEIVDETHLSILKDIDKDGKNIGKHFRNGQSFKRTLD